MGYIYVCCSLFHVVAVLLGILLCPPAGSRDMKRQGHFMTWACPVASGTGSVRRVEEKQGLKCLGRKTVCGTFFQSWVNGRVRYQRRNIVEMQILSFQEYTKKHSINKYNIPYFFLSCSDGNLTCSQHLSDFLSLCAKIPKQYYKSKVSSAVHKCKEQK